MRTWTNREDETAPECEQRGERTNAGMVWYAEQRRQAQSAITFSLCSAKEVTAHEMIKVRTSHEAMMSISGAAHSQRKKAALIRRLSH